MQRRSRIALLSAGVAAVAAAATVAIYPHAAAPAVRATASSLPTPAHIVVVMEENHSYSDIIGNTSSAPYFNSLASQGALLTSSYAVTHPSEPNYMALFARQHVRPVLGRVPDQRGHQGEPRLRTAGRRRHVQGLLRGPAVAPVRRRARRAVRAQALAVGQLQQRARRRTRCRSRRSRRTTPACRRCRSSSRTSTTTCTTARSRQADTWLNNNLSAYATWAKSNNSLLIVTWDEDDYTENNQIPTIVVGQPVKAGQYSETINHYNLLATLEQMYGLSPASATAPAPPRSPTSGTDDAVRRCVGRAAPSSCWPVACGRRVLRPRHRRRG